MFQVMLGEDEDKAYEEAKGKPMLFMPANEDDATVKHGGKAEKQARGQLSENEMLTLLCGC